MATSCDSVARIGDEVDHGTFPDAWFSHYHNVTDRLKSRTLYIKGVSPLGIKWFPSTYAADRLAMTQFASSVYGDCRSVFLELWKEKTSMVHSAGCWK